MDTLIPLLHSKGIISTFSPSFSHETAVILLSSDKKKIFDHLFSINKKELKRVAKDVNPFFPGLSSVIVLRNYDKLPPLEKYFDIDGEIDHIEEYKIHVISLKINNKNYIGNLCPTDDYISFLFDRTIRGLAICELNCLIGEISSRIFQRFTGLFMYKGYKVLVQPEERPHCYLGEIQLSTEFLANHLPELINGVNYLNSLNLFTSSYSIRVGREGFEITDVFEAENYSNIENQILEIKSVISYCHKIEENNFRLPEVMRMIIS